MFASGKKWCLAIVACAVMVIAAASWAQPEGKKDAPGPAPGKEAVPRRVQMFWANSDTNKDGVVDLKEYVAVQEKTFARIDSDANRKLSRLELEKFSTPQKGAGGARAERPGAGRPGRRPEMVRRFVERRDADGDGKLSRSELPPQIADRFDAMDANGDGSLSGEEIGRGRQLGRQQPFGRQILMFWEKADTDKDGSLDPNEYAAVHKMIFSRMDTDGDAKLTREEFATPRRRGRQAGPPGEGRAGRGQDMIKRMFSDADANGDGKISRDEAPAQVGDRFDAIDSNSDGFLTIEEIQQAMRRRGGGTR